MPRNRDFESRIREPALHVTGPGRIPEKASRLQRRHKTILAPAATTYTRAAAKNPTRLEHAGKLENRRSRVGKTMQAVEGQCQVKGVVLEGQGCDIGIGELHQVGHPQLSRPTARPPQHVRGNVSGHVAAILPRAQAAKGKSTTARDVKHVGAGASFTDTLNIF